MFINNAYWIPCSFCFVFKSTHQLGSVYNLLSLGKNPRLREWSQLTPNSQLLREYPGFEPRSGPSSLSHHSGQQVLPVWQGSTVEALRDSQRPPVCRGPSGHNFLTCSQGSAASPGSPDQTRRCCRLEWGALSCKAAEGVPSLLSQAVTQPYGS